MLMFRCKKSRARNFSRDLMLGLYVSHKGSCWLITSQVLLTTLVFRNPLGANYARAMRDLLLQVLSKL